MLKHLVTLVMHGFALDVHEYSDNNEHNDNDNDNTNNNDNYNDNDTTATTTTTNNNNDRSMFIVASQLFCRPNVVFVASRARDSPGPQSWPHHRGSSP